MIPILHSAAAPPSQRVQFLLGEEEDEDHRTHDIFCEMAELFPAGDDKEWKETARSDFVKQFILQLANLRHEIVSDCLYYIYVRFRSNSTRYCSEDILGYYLPTHQKMFSIDSVDTGTFWSSGE